MKYIYKVGGLLAISGVFFTSNVFAQGGVEEIIATERARQIARQISGNVSNRILNQISAPEEAQQNALLSEQKNPMAASSDGNSYLPDSVWATTSWTEISDDNISVNVDADVYQVTGGIDKRFGDVFVGLSTTYAYTETEIGGIGSQGDTHTVSVTPYAAFVLTDNFFISGLTSYSYSRTEPDIAFGNFDSDTDDYTSELTFNAVNAVNDWFFKGKTGFRYRHSDVYNDVSAFQPADNDSDDWTYLVDAEVGYSFGHGIRGFAGALYEYTETENGEDDGVMYMSTGIDYTVSNDLSVGIKYSTDVNNEDIDIHTVGLNLRLAL